MTNATVNHEFFGQGKVVIVKTLVESNGTMLRVKFNEGLIWVDLESVQIVTYGETKDMTEYTPPAEFVAKYSGKTKVTAAKAKDLWETAILFNNELCYLTSGILCHRETEEQKEIARQQLKMFRYKLECLADGISDMYSNVKTVQASLNATRSYCLTIVNNYKQYSFSKDL